MYNINNVAWVQQFAYIKEERSHNHIQGLD
jgi:hypothetical protein